MFLDFELLQLAGFRTCWIGSILETIGFCYNVDAILLDFCVSKSTRPGLVVFLDYLANLRVAFLVRTEFDCCH